LQAALGIQGGTFTIDHKELSFRFSWVADRKRRSRGDPGPDGSLPFPAAVAGLAVARVLS
jgi:hypothetical protein